MSGAAPSIFCSASAPEAAVVIEVALGGQQVGQQLQIDRRVVDDQDAALAAHVRAPAGRSRISRTISRKGRTLIGLDW